MDGRDRDNDWQSRRWQGEGKVVRSSDPKLRPKHETNGSGGSPSVELSDTDSAGNRGKHCAHCNQLDFLPMRCANCTLSFCVDCSSPTDHGCSGEPMMTLDRFIPECPLCLAVVPVLPGQDANRVVELHIRAGCPSPSGLAPSNHCCSHPKCKKREPVAIVCRGCGHNFCIKHRDPLKHRCGAVAAAASLRPTVAKAASRSRSFATGAAIVVGGLVNLESANGKLGTVQSFDAKLGRYVVQLEGGKALKLKPENIMASGVAVSVAAAAASPAPAPSTLPGSSAGGYSPVEQLVAMMGGGFDRAAAAAALRMCNGDVQAAALQLLDDQAARDARGARDRGRLVRSRA